jgi:hypothetical protein
LPIDTLKICSFAFIFLSTTPLYTTAFSQQQQLSLMQPHDQHFSDAETDNHEVFPVRGLTVPLHLERQAEMEPSLDLLEPAATESHHFFTSKAILTTFGSLVASTAITISLVFLWNCLKIKYDF